MQFASTYKVEPELSLYAQRSVRLSAEALKGRRILVVLLLVLNGGCGLFCLSNLSVLRTLQREGKTLHTPILKKWVEHGKTTTYYLKYAFTVAGHTFTDSQDVSEETYDQVHVGRPLLVTYLPRRPAVHRVGVVNEARIAASKRASALIICLLTAFLCLPWMLVETDYHRQLQLARLGVPVPGLIVSCTPPEPNTKMTDYKVSYTFISPAGREQTGSTQIPPDMGKQLVPQMTVTVLCDRDKPARHALYLSLKHVRVEGATAFTLAV
jgi:hypothetical protein